MTNEREALKLALSQLRVLGVFAATKLSAAEATIQSAVLEKVEAALSQPSPASVSTLPALPSIIPDGTPLAHAVREYARQAVHLSQPSPAVPVAWEYQNQHGKKFLSDTDPSKWHPHDQEGFKAFRALVYAAPQPTEPAQPNASLSMCPHQHAIDDWRLHQSQPTGPAQPATQAGAGDRQMKECADHMDWLAARLTEVHGEKFNMDYILAARRWAGWLRHKAAPTTEQPATQAGAGEMDSEHWAELFRLRNAVKGPAGYETWQDAATAERVRRVKAERALAEAAPTTEQPGDAATITPPDWGPIHTLVSGKVELWPDSFRDYLDGAFLRGVRAARAAHGKGGQG